VSLRTSGRNDRGQLSLSVWVRLLKTHGLVLRLLRRRLPKGLTVPQFDVLAQLHRRPEGMTPRELTFELLVTAGNLTGIVERLVRMGLVERHPVPRDRRAVLLRLSARGRRAMAREIPRHRQELLALLSHVPEAELRRIRDLLGRVNRGLEQRDA
jgi:DNA-binding MarR family transcriptional regulator